jgi:imidazolonepropionase-like amidohydrolase
MLRWNACVLALLCAVTLSACAEDVPTPLPTAALVAPTIPPSLSVVTPSHPLPTVTLPPQPSATPVATTDVPTVTFDLVLVGGTLIDGSGGAPLSDAVVAIRGDRIAAVGPAGTIPIAPGTPTRDLGGKTVLPGFINVHAHTSMLSDQALKVWTRAGITTVRDLSGPHDAIIARRKALAASGDATLPRLLVAGPMITVPGGHPIPIYGLSESVLTVQGPDDARTKISALLDAGVDVIKIAVSGRSDVNWPELSNEEIRAITATARARDVPIAAHVDRAVALRRAVENGITDAAHMPRDRMPDELIALMVERDVALVPTIAVYEALAEERGDAAAWRQTTLPVMQSNLRRFVEAGGRLALGDDFGNPRLDLGMPVAEIGHWLDAGLAPMQIIVAATHGGAVVCNLEDQLGTIEPGKLADILVVDGDPLADIRALERVAFVVRGGEVIPVQQSG